MRIVLNLEPCYKNPNLPAHATLRYELIHMKIQTKLNRECDGCHNILNGRKKWSKFHRLRLCMKCT
eukprot:UN20640